MNPRKGRLWNYLVRYWRSYPVVRLLTRIQVGINEKQLITSEDREKIIQILETHCTKKYAEQLFNTFYAEKTVEGENYYTIRPTEFYDFVRSREKMTDLQKSKNEIIITGYANPNYGPYGGEIRIIFKFEEENQFLKISNMELEKR